MEKKVNVLLLHYFELTSNISWHKQRKNTITAPHKQKKANTIMLTT